MKPKPQDPFDFNAVFEEEEKQPEVKDFNFGVANEVDHSHDSEEEVSTPVVTQTCHLEKDEVIPLHNMDNEEQHEIFQEEKLESPK